MHLQRGARGREPVVRDVELDLAEPRMQVLEHRRQTREERRDVRRRLTPQRRKHKAGGWAAGRPGERAGRRPGAR